MLGAISSAHAAPLSYTITDIGTAAARSINDAGTVVGGANSEAYSYDSTTGTRNDLSAIFTGHDGVPISINNSGTIVGERGWYNYSGIEVSSSMVVTDLGPMGGKAPNASSACGISDNGTIVGFSKPDSRFSPDANRTAVKIDSTGVVNNLPALPGYSGATALSINNVGTVIVGTSTTSDNNPHAVMWDSTGAIHDLSSVLSNGSFSYALDVNNSGTIVGFYSYGSLSSTCGFVTDSTGNIKALDLLPGTLGTVAEAINNEGTIVGGSLYADGTQHALIIDSKGVEQDLYSLLTPDDKSKYTYLWAANDINNKGQIITQAMTPSGQWHTVIMTPVPEPSTTAWLAVGTLSMLVFGWKNRK